MPLGFMTGDRFYEGYDFENWAKTLAGPHAGNVRWRPGGGFYSDESLSGMVEKAHDIGRQVSKLPAHVKVIQSEVENFPYDLLRKSAETTIIEAAAHMAAGSTSTRSMCSHKGTNPLDEYRQCCIGFSGRSVFMEPCRPIWTALLLPECGLRGTKIRS